MTSEFSQKPGRGKRLVNFVIVLFILSLGMGIGTLISYRVGATGPGDSQLQIQTDGKPVAGGAVLSLSQAFEEVAKRLEPAVVNVNTEQIVRRTTRRGQQPQDEEDPLDFFHRFLLQQPMPEQYKRASLGTGVIVDPKGYVVTNNHVIDGATKIKVKLPDGQEYQAKVIGADPLSDIAVIKIDGSKDFPFAKVGDSKAMKVGDWVLAIGSPFGLEQTVTAGIISTTGGVFDQDPEAGQWRLLGSHVRLRVSRPLLVVVPPLAGLTTAARGLGWAHHRRQWHHQPHRYHPAGRYGHRPEQPRHQLLRRHRQR